MLTSTGNFYLYFLIRANFILLFRSRAKDKLSGFREYQDIPRDDRRRLFDQYMTQLSALGEAKLKRYSEPIPSSSSHQQPVQSTAATAALSITVNDQANLDGDNVINGSLDDSSSDDDDDGSSRPHKRGKREKKSKKEKKDKKDRKEKHKREKVS